MVIVADIHDQDDVRRISRGEAPEPRNAATLSDGLSKTTADRHELVEESEHIEQIGFA